jgi:hypothetical protein
METEGGYGGVGGSCSAVVAPIDGRGSRYWAAAVMAKERRTGGEREASERFRVCAR